jgi:uncharacterized protein
MALKRKKGWGFSFDPSACSRCPGRCCTGASGYIWVGGAEIRRIASSVALPLSEFLQRYLLKVGGSYSLKEKRIAKDNFACIFFDVESNACSVYEVRPDQCRTFPFWNHFRKHPGEAEEECPGVLLDPRKK